MPPFLHPLARSPSDFDPVLPPLQGRVHVPKRRKTNLNSGFNQMVETMNHVHSHQKSNHRRNRRSINDSLPITKDRRAPTTPGSSYSSTYKTRVGSDFSLIKMKKSPSTRIAWTEEISADGSSSPFKGSKASSGNTCTPLPAWLADTFSTLTSKHPLRLLLPPGLQSSSPGPPSTIPPFEEDTNPLEESVFAFNPFDESESTLVDTRADEHPLINTSSPYLKQLTECTSIDFYADADEDKEPSFLPFTTPGPCSTISYAHDPVTPLKFHFPITYPQNSSSDDHIPSDSPVPQTYKPEEDAELDDITEEAIILDDTDAYRHPFASIFTTPGPGYYAPHPIHHESPISNPSDPPQADNGYEVDYDNLDFHWESFNRKGRDSVHEEYQESKIGGDIDACTLLNPDTVDEIGASYWKTLTQRPRITDPCPTCSTPEPRRHTSPRPFRFVPPIEEDKPPSPTAVSREMPEDYAKPPSPVRPAFSPVQGIFVSPLRDTLDEKASKVVKFPADQVQRLLTGSDFTDNINQKARLDLQEAAIFGRDGIHDQVELRSQSSVDSIESWGCIE
ncbi:hypothetical protein BDQ12DRAFT_730705 [Crucibulum laeve]|uniref:Uncharacterized protein n=1 Tax=Crucibulum laeve TaxID=68775 RepID=A0A5C3MJ00_9AGAR|nr:hypothetical protein BDQ12DRAFT_730705 [Crucibulum laeve]